MSRNTSETGIGSIPTPIFRIIQTYISKKDYYELMKSNRSTFRGIGYETMSYDLIGPERWSKMFPHLNDTSQESSFLDFIQKRVKDPSKQIMIHMKNPRLRLLRQYSHWFPRYPCKVSIDNEELSVDDFNIFNNIYHVSLSSSEEIEAIDGGFENVKILELSHLENLESATNINQSRTIERFTISNCGYYNTVLNFPLDNCVSLEIDTTLVKKFTTFLPKLQRLRILCQPLGDPLPPHFADILRLPTIEYAKIDARLPPDFDFSIFQNIPDLALNHFAPLDKNTSGTPFLPFCGKSLLYVDGTLSLWASSSFANLRKLHLACCSGVINFQAMPELRHLSISDCLDFQIIPSLPKVTYMSLTRCNALVSLAPSQPSLHTLHINQCEAFKDIPDLRKQTMRLMRLNSCSSVSDLSKLGKVVVLEIDRCNGITSEEELNKQEIGRLVFRKPFDSPKKVIGGAFPFKFGI